MDRKMLFLCQLLVGLVFSNHTMAQGGTDTPVNLRSAVEIADQRHHLLNARRYEVKAATKNIDVIRYIKKPAIDASYQANLATANNVTGLFYPDGILPISGPPSYKNDFTPVAGSAASVLLNWQAITFGQQNAQIDVSVAEANSKRLGLEQERFKNKLEVISKYLDVLLAFETQRIQEQNIKRVEVNLKQSKVLSTTGIRPGVDTALFLSELSKAKVEWLNANRGLETEQWLLAQLMVIDALPIPTDTSLLHTLPTLPFVDTFLTTHPYIQFAQSQMDVSRSKEQLLKKSYLPKLTLFGIAFARGSGVHANGDVKMLDGLGLSRFNYGAGVQLVFPIMKYGEVKKQLQVQNLLTEAAKETLLESNTQLLAQQRIAATTFTSSLSIVAETGRQLKSAQYAFNAMQTRYTTGLVNLSDLVQVQYSLLQAELDVKTAYWNAWKALLLQAGVKGDLNLFLNEIK